MKIACLTVVEIECLSSYPADQHRRHKEVTFYLLTQVSLIFKHRGQWSIAGTGTREQDREPLRFSTKKVLPRYITACINTMGLTRAGSAPQIHTLTYMLTSLWMESPPSFLVFLSQALSALLLAFLMRSEACF